MSVTISSEQFGEICSGVWRDRTAIVGGRGFLSPEAALVRAVYWRLCKAGVKPSGSSSENYGSGQTVLTYKIVVEYVLELGANPRFDGAPFLSELVERYQTEVKLLAKKAE
jgi:hypothetical protein